MTANKISISEKEYRALLRAAGTSGLIKELERRIKARGGQSKDRAFFREVVNQLEILERMKARRSEAVSPPPDLLSVDSNDANGGDEE